eukprot:gene8523-9396_t
MSSERDRSIIQARELDQASTFLVRLGVQTVRRNPIKVSFYLLGLLLCLFFNGFSITAEQRAAYYEAMKKVDHTAVLEASDRLDQSYYHYRSHRGWFSCDATCQLYKTVYDEDYQRYQALKQEEARALSAAKATLGLFSEYAVEETRDLFWQRFTQGKAFASHQTKLDALFMGIGAMARDESFLSYLLRVAFSLLFNLTLGVSLSVVVFLFSLYSIITSYQPSFLFAIFFFILAAAAAISFAVSWLIGLYAIAAGTTYVGIKLLDSNLRIEHNDERQRQRRVR